MRPVIPFDLLLFLGLLTSCVHRDDVTLAGQEGEAMGPEDYLEADADADADSDADADADADADSDSDADADGDLGETEDPSDPSKGPGETAAALTPAVTAEEECDTGRTSPSSSHPMTPIRWPPGPRSTGRAAGLLGQRLDPKLGIHELLQL